MYGVIAPIMYRGIKKFLKLKFLLNTIGQMLVGLGAFVQALD